MVHPLVLFHKAIKFFVVHLMLMEPYLLLEALTHLQGYVKLKYICSELTCMHLLLIIYLVSSFNKGKCQCIA